MKIITRYLIIEIFIRTITDLKIMIKLNYLKIKIFNLDQLKGMYKYCIS